MDRKKRKKHRSFKVQNSPGSPNTSSTPVNGEKKTVTQRKITILKSSKEEKNNVTCNSLIAEFSRLSNSQPSTSYRNSPENNAHGLKSCTRSNRSVRNSPRSLENNNAQKSHEHVPDRFVTIRRKQSPRLESNAGRNKNGNVNNKMVIEERRLEVGNRDFEDLGLEPEAKGTKTGNNCLKHKSTLSSDCTLETEQQQTLPNSNGTDDFVSSINHAEPSSSGLGELSVTYGQTDPLLVSSSNGCFTNGELLAINEKSGTVTKDESETSQSTVDSHHITSQSDVLLLYSGEDFAGEGDVSNESEMTEQQPMLKNIRQMPIQFRTASKTSIPKDVPVLMHTPKTRHGEAMSEILIYKLGSHSTPRKIRKNTHLNCLPKATWGTPETSIIRPNFSNNLITKRKENKTSINKKSFRIIPALLKPNLLNSISIPNTSTKKRCFKNNPLKLLQRADAPVKNMVQIKESDHKNTEEIYTITPVAALIKKFESMSNKSELKETKSTVVIKIKRKNMYTPQNDSPDLAPTSETLELSHICDDQEIDNESVVERSKLVNQKERLKLNINNIGIEESTRSNTDWSYLNSPAILRIYDFGNLSAFEQQFEELYSDQTASGQLVNNQRFSDLFENNNMKKLNEEVDATNFNAGQLVNNQGFSDSFENINVKELNKESNTVEVNATNAGQLVNNKGFSDSFENINEKELNEEVDATNFNAGQLVNNQGFSDSFENINVKEINKESNTVEVNAADAGQLVNNKGFSDSFENINEKELDKESNNATKEMEKNLRFLSFNNNGSLSLTDDDTPVSTLFSISEKLAAVQPTSYAEYRKEFLETKRRSLSPR